MRFVLFGSFWCADIKNNFLKMKKHHWHVFRHEKLFEKHPQPHWQTRFLKSTHNHTVKYTLYSLNRSRYFAHKKKKKREKREGGSPLEHAWYGREQVREVPCPIDIYRNKRNCNSPFFSSFFQKKQGWIHF